VSAIGCAGWSLPRAVQDAFGAGASHLARYATRLPVTEINSSFHRPHRRSVYEKWAASVPDGFRFCAKVPKAITHERRLAACEDLLDAFLAESGGLGDQLACLLVQLPPSFAFDAPPVTAFLRTLRARFARGIALEPRHASWFTQEADALLRAHQVARVLADPVRHEAATAPGGWPGLVYLRLHGSPRVYYSAYDTALLQQLAARLRQSEAEGADCWCIFDNTAAGAATANALELQRLLEERR
jgi:uncharacterized protein YecE (DUF72 family)